MGEKREFQVPDLMQLLISKKEPNTGSQIKHWKIAQKRALRGGHDEEGVSLNPPNKRSKER